MEEINKSRSFEKTASKQSAKQVFLKRRNDG